MFTENLRGLHSTKVDTVGVPVLKAYNLLRQVLVLT